MSVIKNRYEFLFLIDCINGNPNGDPDTGNLPRIDPQDMHGLISDVAVKRRIRNYVQTAYGNDSPNAIIIQESTNVNRFIAKAHEETGGMLKKATKDKVKNAREWLCRNFYDVRAFGAVLSTGANAGQVRGPVQLSFLRSVDAILPVDITITRMAVTDNTKGKTSSEDILAWEKEQPEEKLRTMGRKTIIPYGLYLGHGFISANLAEKMTGFSDEDLKILWDALLNLYEHDRSASKGLMSVKEPLIIFRHDGTDTDASQRERQAKLGCAPAHKLFDMISAEKKDKEVIPRKFSDYKIKIDMSKLPNGISLGLGVNEGGNARIYWNEIPSDLSESVMVV